MAIRGFKMDDKSLAKTAYEAYCAASNNVSVHGEQLPAFDSLKEATKDHWQAAALAVTQGSGYWSGFLTGVVAALFVCAAAYLLFGPGYIR
jgi:hypothetical protein